MSEDSANTKTLTALINLTLHNSQKSPTAFNQSGRTVTTGGWLSLVPSARE